MSEIKIGDNIYLRQYSRLIRIETVVSLPKTMIRSENYNYSYPSEGSNYLHIKGQDRWTSISAHLETEELKQEWHEERLKNWIKNNYSKIPLDLVDEIKKRMENTGVKSN